MTRFTRSEWYAIAAVGALLLTAVLNIPALTLSVAGLGLIAGAAVSRRAPLTRAGQLALIGFAVSAALGAYALLR